MTEKKPIEKHPVDWATEKKTPRPMFCLAVALAWHKRITEQGDLTEALIDGKPPYEGPIVDPQGEETQEMTEGVYNTMIADAAALMKQVRESCKTADEQAVIIPHDGLHYALIMARPSGRVAPGQMQSPADKFMDLEIQARREERDDVRLQTLLTLFNSHVRWPRENTPEKHQFLDRLGAAVYPLHDVFVASFGMRGSDAKKKL